jgi:hypothetical protein
MELKANPRWVLDVGVFVKYVASLTTIDKRLKKAVGRDSDSGGCGFGVRDGQWEFDTEAEAEKAREAVGKEFREAELDYANTYELNEEDEV